MNLVSPNGASSVDWIQGSVASNQGQLLKWHKVRKCSVMETVVTKLS